MKRLLLGLAVAAVVCGPMTMATSASADPAWSRDDGYRSSRGHDRDRGYERRDRYEDRRDRDDRGDWDRGGANGYYYNNRFFYGPPPHSYQTTPGYRPGYNAWRRGATLPPYYRGAYVSDYYRYHLRPPPRGYAWYRVGDDYLLAAVATGLIFEIIAGN